MKSKRDGKKRKKQDRNGEQWKKRRRRSLEILKALDIWDAIKDTKAKDMFLGVRYPVPKITLSNDTRTVFDDKNTLPSATEILSSAREIVKNCRFPAPGLSDQFSVVEYFTTVKPILELLTYIQQSFDWEINEDLKRVQDRTAELAHAETATTAVATLIRDIDDLLIKHGRIDEQLYFVNPDYGRNESKQFFVELLVECQSANRRFITTDGKPRPAYHCGQPYQLSGLEWIEWDGKIIGKVSGKQYPVFVQDHVLDRLYRKPDEARALFIENSEWLVHDYLWQSLHNPRIVGSPRNDGKFLIEYWLYCHKLGYLVSSVIDDIVLIHTFLFLTMDGTPEGDRLWKKLRLQKDDKKYLGLDRLKTYLDTDIQHDDELRKILNDCGCGHLFSIRESPLPLERCVPDYAEDLHKYLQLHNRTKQIP